LATPQKSLTAQPLLGRLAGRLELDLRPLTAQDIVVLAAPALIALEIRIVGRLFVTEVILLVTLAYLLVTQKRLRLDRAITVFVTCGVVWLASQMLTDLVRHSAFHDFSRGWLKIFFTLSTLIALDLLFANDRRRLVLFALGLSVGLLIQYFLSPDYLARIDGWKFGVGLPVTLLLVLLASQRGIQRRALLPTGILGVAAALNLLMGFRSLGGVCFLAAGYVAFQRYFARKPHGAGRLGVRRVLVISVLTILLGLGFLKGYAYAAEHGLLGSAAQTKYANESSGGFGAVFFNARPNFYIGLKAIAASPIIGHGSWAHETKYTIEGLADLERHGYSVDPNLRYGLLREDTIPSHSYLLGAWVEGGVVGGIFWLLVLGLVGAVFLTLYRLSDPISPLIAFSMMFLAWNVLFSPYGAEQRIIAPYTILVLLYAWRQARGGTVSDPVPSSEGWQSSGTEDSTARAAG
jgi:hypothetical protein